MFLWFLVAFIVISLSSHPHFFKPFIFYYNLSFIFQKRGLYCNFSLYFLMLLITSSKSTFIKGVLIWQLNYFYQKVAIIRLFRNKHETEIMGQRSKPGTTQSFLRGIPDWKREADWWHFFQQLMKISREVKSSNSLKYGIKSHFRLTQSSQKYFILI